MHDPYKKPVICPAILASNEDDYRKQVERVIDFTHRIQIDLTDGQFAQSQTIGPDQAWWPVGMKADLHLMYKNPLSAIQTLLPHRPNLIIVHAEAQGEFESIASICHQHKVKVGVALLPRSDPHSISRALDKIDHVLIFSGDLGKFGGHANLDLLSKARYLKEHKPHLEIGWDGGVNSHNAAQLILGGVDVLNVGGFIQNSEDPAKAFHRLRRIAEETGTT